METRGRASQLVDSKSVDATDTHQNGQHLLGSTQGSDEGGEEDLEMEAIQRNTKPEISAEGEIRDEAHGSRRGQTPSCIKKMNPHKRQYQLRDTKDGIILSAMSTTCPASVESAVLALMSGIIKTEDIDSLDNVAVR